MEKPVSLVQLRTKRQLTVPREIAQALDLQEGDYMEAAVEGNRLVFSVKEIQDRTDQMPKSTTPTNLATFLDQMPKKDPKGESSLEVLRRIRAFEHERVLPRREPNAQ